MVKTVEMELPGIPGKQKGIVLNLTTEREDWNVYVDHRNGIRVRVKRPVIQAIYFPDIKQNDGSPVCFIKTTPNDIVAAEFIDEDEEVLRP